ncbi:Protein ACCUMULATION AND REPLICATION OF CHLOROPLASTS 3 [Dendrobium catenatum]|uniref:Protein ACCUMULATION AND REPLICATION OF CHLOROPLASTS 3 n=2 Tax=Dendrobium catenatum TaxID=906689 RepID=A0A2I0WS94_9ASPA|nr:Protein ACCUMULATION AND REPLICATION OF CHLOROPLASTS 3 [Dendrobium catenatum]
MQAIFHCPLFVDGLKGFNRLAIMLLTSSCNIGENDMLEINSSFRGITGYSGEIIFSKMCEPNLEPKFVVTTLLLMGGHNEKMVTHNKGFLSSILENLPFFYRFFKINSTEASNLPANHSFGDPLLASASGSKSVWDLSHLTKLVYPLEHNLNQGAFSDKLENVTLRNDSCHETTGEVAELGETNNAPMSKFGNQPSGGKQGIAVVKQGGHEIGPAFHVAQLWAKKCSASRSKKNDKVDTFSLPVGVKSSKLEPDSKPYSNHVLAENSDYINNEVLGGITSDMSKKDSLLSVRAAMMLEAERESLKSWNPVVEIQYKGGMYRGRCRAGLPDGKGRLTSMDGSFYEGFWKCGKRSGLGTFCYSNGDLFRGPWRDDLMHGKGWFYFHTGDRWFANFWRGKANGEGRFFSKNGSVFFGFFRDGWRHGRSVCIDADGSRWTELWDDGILVNRTPLDK